MTISLDGVDRCYTVPVDPYLYTVAGSIPVSLAVKILSQNPDGFALIVNETGKFRGVLTDSDVRKALLAADGGVCCLNERATFVSEGDVNRAWIDKYQTAISSEKLVPVLDSQGGVRALIRVFPSRQTVDTFGSTPVLIMAGGKGVRLGDLTKDRPKPMVELSNIPMLERLILDIKKRGFLKIYISVCHKSQMITEYFGDGAEFGVSIEYLREKRPLGTAGALSLIRDSTSLLMMNCDIYSDVDLGSMWLQFLVEKNDIAIATNIHRQTIDFGVLSTDSQGYVTSLKEKPVFQYVVSMGVYCLSKSVVELAASLVKRDGYLDFPELLNASLEEGLCIKTHTCKGFWLDLGRPSDVEKASTVERKVARYVD